MSVGLSRSSKYPSHHPTISSAAVSSIWQFSFIESPDGLPEMLQDSRKAFFHALTVFASATTQAAFCLNCQYPSAASEVLQANHTRQNSFSLMTPFTSSVHQLVLGVTTTTGTNHFAATAQCSRFNISTPRKFTNDFKTFILHLHKLKSADFRKSGGRKWCVWCSFLCIHLS